MKSTILLFSALCFSQLLFAQTKVEPKLVIDNAEVKVYEYDSKPGKDVCGLGKHSHPAHLTILITDANLTLTSPDGKVSLHKMTAGSTFWSEAGSHTVINSGTGDVKCQMVELKKKS